MAKSSAIPGPSRSPASPESGEERETQEAQGLRLEQFLPYRLSILSNTISSSIADTYAEKFSLRIPEWRVIAVLGRYPGISAREVATRTAMDKVAVSRAVARLLDSGRVTRQTADSDRRRSILNLSGSGKRIYQKISPMALDYERHLLNSFSNEERETLGRLLDRLTVRATELRRGS